MNDEENFMIGETIKPKIVFKSWFFIHYQIKINSSKPKLFLITTRTIFLVPISCYNNN